MKTAHLVYLISYDELKKRKANWIGHILHKNCLLKCVVEGLRYG